MKLRLNHQAGRGQRAELLIRHPNFNGMQMDQVTRLYTPARYINSIDVAYNGQRVFHMDADISLASDPAIGFGFKSDGSRHAVGAGGRYRRSATWHQDFPVPPHGTDANSLAAWRWPLCLLLLTAAPTRRRPNPPACGPARCRARCRPR